MAISSFGNKEATRATEKRLRRVAETPAKLVMSTDFPAAPRLNEPLPAYFESACGGSTPPGAISGHMAAQKPHGRVSQVCRRCRELTSGADLLTAIPVNRLAAAALAELLSRRRSCERIAEALVR
jgi:hypothetical protein